MIISKKTLLSTAVKAALIGAITIPMVGCDDAETYNQQQYVEAESNFVQQQRQQLVGNVQGVVLDSNGNPLENAEVSIGTQTTTTDALGYYAFADVAAVNVVKNGDDTGLDSDNANKLVAQPIEVSVSAVGHLGGRTQVYPTAISDTQQFVYIDGFTAQAKNLYLPELAASVKATLRSDITGEAIANKTVTFEFIALNSTPQAQGEFASLASQSFSAVTDAEGAFEATGLPANSSFEVLVEGYSVDNKYVLDETGKTKNSIFTTSDEPIVSNWGEIFVTEHIVADLIRPFVRNIQYVTSSVSGTGVDSKYTGYLAKGKDGTVADGGLVFELSESVSILNRQSDGKLDENTVKVLRVLGDDSAEYLDFTTTQSSGNVNSIQINLNTPLAAGEEIDVYFEIEDFVDANANRLTTEGVAAIAQDNPDTANIDESNPYHRVADSIGEGAKSNYIKYNITAYKPATDLGDIGSVDQNDSALSETFELLSQHNAAFKGHGDYNQDGDAGTSEISQINNASNANTGALLAALAAELTKASAIPDLDKVFTNTAEIVVSLPAGTTHVDVSITTTSAADNSNAANELKRLINNKIVEMTEINNVIFIVKGVNPGDRIKITPQDGFGVANEDKAVFKTLEDNIAPTAILQDSYDVIDNDISDDGEYRVSGSSLGGDYTIDGGSRVTVEDQGELGFPYLAITPSILNIDDKKADVSGDLVNNGVGDDGDNVYDSDDYDVWSVKSATTAIAFSEEVKWTSISAPTQSSVAPGVTSNLLSNFDIVANTPASQDSDNPHAISQAQDFVIFDVKNMFTFANDNNGEKINFNGRLVDTSGNAASAAVVVVQDKLPPMIASAELKGVEGDLDSQELIITFSEDLLSKSNYTADVDASVFRIQLAGVTYSTAIENSFKASDIDISGNTVTIEINELKPEPTFVRSQEITDLKVHIADKHGNEGDTQYGDEVATTFNYNHVEKAKTLMFKVENKITAP